MYYKKKYSKYKFKKTTLQHGGDITIAEIDPIIVANKIKENTGNVGQNNCGVIFIGDYAVKCLKLYDENVESDETMLTNHVEKINTKLAEYYPKYYKWPNNKIENFIEIQYEGTKKYAKCIIMDKLDGDLTTYILKQSYLNVFGNYDDYNFFYDRLPKTMIDYIDDEISSENKKKYNIMKEKIKDSIIRKCYLLNNSVIKLHLNIIKRGYYYNDLKLDNIGFIKKEDSLLPTLLFIDEESGLSEINNEDFTNYLNIHAFNKPIQNYGVNGQYTLSYIFNMNRLVYEFEWVNLIKTLEIQNISVVNNNDSFNWVQFRKGNSNNSFVIQYVMGYFRFVVFDDNLRHMSNPLYNSYFQMSDELIENIDEVYMKINEM